MITIPPQLAISSQASRVDPSPLTFTNPMLRWSVFLIIPSALADWLLALPPIFNPFFLKESHQLNFSICSLSSCEKCSEEWEIWYSLVSDWRKKYPKNDRGPEAFTNSSVWTPTVSKESELKILACAAAHLKSRATIANVSSLDVLCTLCPVSNPGHVFDVLLDPGVLPVVFQVFAVA